MNKNCLIAAILILLGPGIYSEELYSQQKDELSFLVVSQNLNMPESVYVTPRGTIYVVERGNHRLLVFDSEGKLSATLGNQGFGEFQFNRPTDVDGTNGLKIYIADSNNGRVQVYDNRFQFLSAIQRERNSRFPGEIEPTYVTANPMGDLFIYDSGRHRILKYNTNGIFETERSLRGMEIAEVSGMNASEDSIYLLDKESGIIHVLNQSLQYRQFYGGWDHLQAMFVKHGQFVVMDGSELVHMNLNGQVQNRKTLVQNDFKAISFYGRVFAAITEKSLVIYDFPFLQQFR